MNDFKVILPTTTEEWQRDMKLSYEKAIDDFATEIKNLISGTSVLRCRDIEEIAEQLKAGGK